MPEVLAIHGLPDMFNAAGILSHHQLGEILDGSHDTSGVPFQRGLSPAIKSWLVGEDLDENPVSHAGMTDVGFNGGYAHQVSFAGERSRGTFSLYPVSNSLGKVGSQFLQASCL